MSAPRLVAERPSSSTVLLFEYLSGGGLGKLESERLPLEQAALLAQGLAMRDAVAADLARHPALTLTVVQGPGVPACPSGRGVRAAPGLSLLEAVAREARSHAMVWGIAPETDGYLLALHDAVGAERWLGCDREALVVGSSKRATLARVAAACLPTPRSFEAEATRWVVKPDDGAGTVDTRVHASRGAAEADLASRQQAGLDATLEPWVEGEAFSVLLLVLDERVEVLGFNRQHLALAGDGSLRYEGVEPDAWRPGEAARDAAAHLARRVVEAVPGLHGVLGLDLVWHPRRGPVLIELNPRTTCGFVGASARLGRSLAAEVAVARAARGVRVPQHA